MSEEYNPHSIDATLARIESKLDAGAAESREYRAKNDAKLDTIHARLADLEGDRKKLCGIAIGGSIGAGGLGAALSKFFGH